MGLWAKAKGVFGRIGRGIKKGWNWLRDHKDKIADIATKTANTMGGKTLDTYNKYKGRTEGIYNKADQIAKGLGI